MNVKKLSVVLRIAFVGFIAGSLPVHSASAQAARGLRAAAEFVGLAKPVTRLNPLSVRAGDGPLYGYRSSEARGPKTFELPAHDQFALRPESGVLEWDSSKLNSLTDRQAFINYCISGADRDFDRLRNEKRDLVRGVLHGRGIQRANIDDVEQEVWLRFLVAHRTGKCAASDGRNPNGWLVKMTKNVASEIQSKRGVATVPLQDEDLAAAPIDVDRDYVERCIKKRLRDPLDQTIALRRIDGQRPQEISKELRSVPRTTISSRRDRVDAVILDCHGLKSFEELRAAALAAD